MCASGRLIKFQANGKLQSLPSPIPMNVLFTMDCESKPKRDLCHCSAMQHRDCGSFGTCKLGSGRGSKTAQFSSWIHLVWCSYSSRRGHTTWGPSARQRAHLGPMMIHGLHPTRQMHMGSY